MAHNKRPPQNVIAGRFLLPLRDSTGGEPFTLDVDFEIPGHGVTGIFGPSGSGKTTLLRCIAGLQPCENASLLVNGTCWQSPDSRDSRLAVHRRPLGYVFQQPSLFPHLTAEGNLSFARKRAAQTVTDQEFDEIVALMGIAPLLSQRPDALSGGEQQRVAIARALLVKPELLLMDEPLAALDQARKREILPYLEKLHRSLDIPILYVSHSIEEIARLADHLLLLENGRIQCAGAATELLSRTDFPVQVGDDLGVLLGAEVMDRNPEWNLMRARFGGGELWLRDSGESVGEQLRVRILARDVSLTLEEDQQSSILNRLPMCVDEVSADSDPAMVLVRLRPRNITGSEKHSCVIARITRRSSHLLELEKGTAVWAQIKSVAIVR
ncbi:molybdenum ABC transporter ATP-binding protein [Microbulbifer sp. HZ11]|uniref:molybdenum ABC transporter ATP-binding protein n=1 Tax=unclassified Microbulbifer TaxID=2619833 RepID=UPI0009DE5D35|nr:molybdenum ABC transporter ATP-binding protein [Microbulbifer sp. HZ11]